MSLIFIMNISGIYQIQSKIKPERIYIGSAVSINHRWNMHLFRLRRNEHHSLKLQNHYNKYGEFDLQFSILLGCDKEDLIKIEQYFWIHIIRGLIFAKKQGVNLAGSEFIKKHLIVHVQVVKWAGENCIKY